jgi:cytochrome c553
MKPILACALAFALAAVSLPAAAQGDPARGQTLFYTCTGCHGIADYKNVYPLYRVPKLGGQNEQYLIIAMKAYRSGERTHSTMQAQGEALTDQDIADIAAYLSSHKQAK